MVQGFKGNDLSKVQIIQMYHDGYDAWSVIFSFFMDEDAIENYTVTVYIMQNKLAKVWVKPLIL